MIIIYQFDLKTWLRTCFPFAEKLTWSFSHKRWDYSSWIWIWTKLYVWLWQKECNSEMESYRTQPLCNMKLKLEYLMIKIHVGRNTEKWKITHKQSSSWMELFKRSQVRWPNFKVSPRLFITSWKQWVIIMLWFIREKNHQTSCLETVLGLAMTILRRELAGTIEPALSWLRYSLFSILTETFV